MEIVKLQPLVWTGGNFRRERDTSVSCILGEKKKLKKEKKIVGVK